MTNLKIRPKYPALHALDDCSACGRVTCTAAVRASPPSASPSPCRRALFDLFLGASSGARLLLTPRATTGAGRRPRRSFLLFFSKPPGYTLLFPLLALYKRTAVSSFVEEHVAGATRRSFRAQCERALVLKPPPPDPPRPLPPSSPLPFLPHFLDMQAPPTTSRKATILLHLTRLFYGSVVSSSESANRRDTAAT